jgi:hypothetical protein
MMVTGASAATQRLTGACRPRFKGLTDAGRQQTLKSMRMKRKQHAASLSDE